MFKIPDWENDIPSPKVTFSKRANNIKSPKLKEPDIPTQENSKKQREPNNNDINDIHKKLNLRQKPFNKIHNDNKQGYTNREIRKPPRKRNHSDTLPDENFRNKDNKTQITINVNTDFKKSAKKQKHSNDNKINTEMEIDEMLLNAKNKEFMEEFHKVDREELLFSEANTENNSTNPESLKQKRTSEISSELITKSAKKPKRKKKKIESEVNTEETNSSNEIQSDLATEKVKSFQENGKAERKKKILKSLLENNHRRSINLASRSVQLRQRMLERFKSAQFRFLNEKLYTSTGDEAKKIFQADPDAFDTYHQGYQQQVKKWPVNPLDIIVKKIQKMPKTYVIADMGCGEAALARRVAQRVHSFDLVARPRLGVTAADMARTPLPAHAVHAAVYCLALMGTDLTQYLVEANRVLKPGGHLLIAEVESRFDDVNAFARDVERLGFKLKSVDSEHKVFFFLHFEKKQDPPKKGRPALQLKPCLYKKR